MKTTFKDDFHRLAKKGFYLYHPVVQAVIISIISAIKFSNAQAGLVTSIELFDFIFGILILYAILSPLAYLFFPNWWLNTTSFIICFVILNIVLIGEYDDIEAALPGPGVGEGAMALMVPWFIPFFLLPITGGIKVVINTSRKWKKEDQEKEAEEAEIPEAFGK